MTTAPATFHDRKARILASPGRMTYGHFEAWITVCGEEAHAKGVPFHPRQKKTAARFGVSWTTIKEWFKRAYRDGLLKPIAQYIRMPDGTGRRIANRYIVARTIRLRGLLAKAWKAGHDSVAAALTSTAKPPIPAVSPNSRFSDQLITPDNHHLQFSAATPTPTAPAPAEKRSFWTCRYTRCSTRNAWPAPSCRQCRSEKPFNAERTYE